MFEAYPLITVLLNSRVERDSGYFLAASPPGMWSIVNAEHATGANASPPRSGMWLDCSVSLQGLGNICII